MPREHLDLIYSFELTTLNGGCAHLRTKTYWEGLQAVALWRLPFDLWVMPSVGGVVVTYHVHLPLFSIFLNVSLIIVETLYENKRMFFKEMISHLILFYRVK